ncbi:MAG: YbbR-like domain-containing protein [Deltaproteobacteria bacterium]|nr:YbbR-like domain-containing protein [Deltaproteobacteria bacterium]
MDGNLQQEGNEGRFKRLFTENVGLKLLALAFSIAIWFFVVGEKQQSEFGMLIPLGLKGIPEDMVMISEPPKDIEVRVAGAKLYMTNLSPSQVSAVLDLSEIEPGSNVLRIEADSFKMPRGVKVVNVSPTTVTIKMERLAKASLPIKVTLTGEVAEGYEVSGIEVEPGEVEILARKKVLKKLKELSTEAIDITAATLAIEEEILIDIDGKNIKAVTPNAVKVTITVSEKPEKPIKVRRR